jgi:hypothetical protein
VVWTKNFMDKFWKAEWKRPLAGPTRKQQYNIKIGLKESGYEDVDQIHLPQDLDHWRALTGTNLQVALNVGNLSTNWKSITVSGTLFYVVSELIYCYSWYINWERKTVSVVPHSSVSIDGERTRCEIGSHPGVRAQWRLFGKPVMSAWNGTSVSRL